MKIITFILLMTFGILDSQELKTCSFQNLPEKSDKPILIYMKTSWCSICKIQIHQIERDSELKRLLNEKVDFIVFDAEKSNEKIKFFGKTYQYISNGNSGIHELAMEISRNKKPLFPTWILIDSGEKVLFYQEGLIDHRILKLQINTSTSLCVTSNKKPSEN
ncbi:thioredoxin family protein [Epilithonimonas sp.]|uniref:thioredoxin family protein n=1 Tax=Epilithonimonas sp. TaxID=2894511 RepID=UPI002FDE3C7D